MVESALGDLDDLMQISKYPYSLEGVGGLVSLMIDLEHPTSDVTFPFFEYLVSGRNGGVAVSTIASKAVGDFAGRNREGGDKETPKKDQSSGPQRDRTSKISSPRHSKQYGKSHTTSVTGTATTVSFTTKNYETPPRTTSAKNISPLTEPSPGNNNDNTSRSAYPLTEAKIRKRREDQKRAKLQQQQQQQEQQTVLFPSRLAPPQMKRHIFTHADDVELAKRPTVSWRNKLKYTKGSREHTAGDDNSIERKQRAEASFYKYKVHNYYKPKKTADDISNHSIRRMVGGFDHHENPKPKPTSSTAGHLYADLDESSSSLMDNVMEQLRERLEQGTKVM